MSLSMLKIYSYMTPRMESYAFTPSLVTLVAMEPVLVTTSEFSNMKLAMER